MLFLFIGYYDSEKMNQSSQQELDAVMERCNPPLETFFTKINVLYEWYPGAETKRARLFDGQIQHQDGPDPDKTEQIGSLMVFEAANLEQAVDLALLHPTTQLPEAQKYGWRMEIRPLIDPKEAE